MIRPRWLFLEVVCILVLRQLHGAIIDESSSVTTAQATATTPSYTAASGCGGYYSIEGNITSPGYPNNFPPYSTCSWILTAANGSGILLEFLDFALDKQNSNLNIWDHVFYDNYYLSGTDSNMTSMRFSSQISLYFSNYNYGTSRGFNIRFTSVATPNTTNTSSFFLSNAFTDCGSNLTNEGNFASPNYPAQYPNNAHCTWIITATPGKVLQLFCISMDLESNYDSINVMSHVYNKTTNTFYGLSGNSSNCSWTLGSNATVVFNSDFTVRRNGFVIGYRSITPPSNSNRTTFTECGGNLSGNGTISSPNYPSFYPNNCKCIWRLRASDGQVLRLYYSAHDLEDPYDTVIIYNSVNVSQGAAINYTSYWQQSMAWSQFNSVVVVFTSDESEERSGFQLYYTSEYPSSTYNASTTTPYVGCGGSYNIEGNVSSPGYPNNFPPYSMCSWILTAANGSGILLEFLDFALDKQNGYLNIWDNVFYDNYYLSGTDSNMTSMRFSSQISLYFSSYNYGTSRGFNIRFTSVATPNTTNTSSFFLSNAFTDCGSNLTNKGNFTSPNYPSQYPNNAHCTWNITATPGKVLQLFCLSMDLENNYDSINVMSHVYNKTTNTFYGLSGNSSNCSWTLGSNATVVFNSDFTVRRNGFVIGYRSITPSSNSNRTTFTECGGNLTGNGTISSPNYPNFYPSNCKCTWRLRASDGQVLRLYFSAHDVEDRYDTVIIYNSVNISQGAAFNYTSYWQQNMVWSHFNSEVVVVFNSDESEERPGFQLYFTSEYPFSAYNTTTTAPYVECGGYLSREGNITTSGYPNNYPPYSSCSWTITAANGSTILLEFLDFALDKQNSYLYIWDNMYYDTYSLSGADSNITSLRFSSKISLKFISYNNTTSRGFSLWFTSIAAPNATNTSSFYFWNSFTSCGSNLTNEGNFTSPNYPAQYPNNAHCKWNIIATPGKLIQLYCISLELENFYDSIFISSQSYNKTSVSYYWFTGNSSNCSWILGASATVEFNSDLTVRRSGFVIGYRSITPPFSLNRTAFTQCGGNLTGNGTVSSPNYPNFYPSNCNCTWRLRASSGQVLRLYFDAHDVENPYDTVIIYNSMNISQGAAINYTSYWLQNMVWLQFNSEVVVVFTSDESEERPGFQLYFTSEYPSTAYNTTTTVSSAGTTSSTATTAVTTTPVAITSTSTVPTSTTQIQSSTKLTTVTTSVSTAFNCSALLGLDGEISSPNFPNAYPSNISCLWTFFAPLGYSYNFEFLNFSTEDNLDYVEIKTGLVAKNRFSGSTLPDAVVVFGYGSISFTSSEYVQMTGFRIRYTRLEPTTTIGTTIETTIGTTAKSKSSGIRGTFLLMICCITSLITL